MHQRLISFRAVTLQHAGTRRKRAVSAPSCTELVWDELFEGAWLAHERDADANCAKAP